MNGLILNGGLGDILLHTPLFKKYSESKNEKLYVFTYNENAYELLKNNKNINLFLINSNYNVNRIWYSILGDRLSNAELKIYLQNRTNIKIFEKHYFHTRAGLFFKKPASELISNLFGIDMGYEKPEIFLSEDEIEKGKKIANYNFSISICNSTAHSFKEWEQSKWDELIAFYPNVRFLQLGLKKDIKVKNAIDCTGYNLREQLSILKNSNHFIGLDSFWGHASAALDVKSVILFGPSTPEIWGHGNNKNIYFKEKCSPCTSWNIGECPYNLKCMKNIQVSDVKKDIDSLIYKD